MFYELMHDLLTKEKKNKNADKTRKHKQVNV